MEPSPARPLGRCVQGETEGRFSQNFAGHWHPAFLLLQGNGHGIETSGFPSPECVSNPSGGRAWPLHESGLGTCGHSENGKFVVTSAPFRLGLRSPEEKLSANLGQWNIAKFIIHDQLVARPSSQDWLSWFMCFASTESLTRGRRRKPARRGCRHPCKSLSRRNALLLTRASEKRAKTYKQIPQRARYASRLWFLRSQNQTSIRCLEPEGRHR